MTDASAAGYCLWRGPAGFHLRAHGRPGEAHRFVAYLHADGRFHDVALVRAESYDGVAIIDQGQTLAIRFSTYNRTDGVNFRIAGGGYRWLDLRLNGERIATDQIYLGAPDRHPAANPFLIRL